MTPYGCFLTTVKLPESGDHVIFTTVTLMSNTDLGTFCVVSCLPDLEYLKETCVYQRRNAVALDCRTEEGGGGTWRGSNTLILGCRRVHRSAY